MPTTTKKKPAAARKAQPLPDTLDAIEIAMGAEGDKPSPDRPAGRLLAAQERLILSQLGLTNGSAIASRRSATSR